MINQRFISQERTHLVINPGRRNELLMNPNQLRRLFFPNLIPVYPWDSNPGRQYQSLWFPTTSQWDSATPRNVSTACWTYPPPFPICPLPAVCPPPRSKTPVSNAAPGSGPVCPFRWPAANGSPSWGFSPKAFPHGTNWSCISAISPRNAPLFQRLSGHGPTRCATTRPRKSSHKIGWSLGICASKLEPVSGTASPCVLRLFWNRCRGARSASLLGMQKLWIRFLWRSSFSLKLLFWYLFPETSFATLIVQ